MFFDALLAGAQIQAGGGAAALAGSAAVSAAATGAVSTGIPLGGHAAPGVSAGAGLTTGIPLSGSAAAGAGANAALATGIPLTAAATVASSATASTVVKTYRPSQIQLSVQRASSDGLYWPRYPQGNRPASMLATASASGAASGNLSTAIRMGGAASGTSTGSGALTTSALFTANRVGNSGGFSPNQSGGLPVFRDRMMESRGYMKAADANTNATRDAAGWPTEDWQTYLTEVQGFSSGPQWNSGTYKCGFTSKNGGAETITGSSCTISNKAVNGNLVTYDLSPTAQATAVNVKVAGTTGGTTNAFAMLPGYNTDVSYNISGDSTKLFTSEYISKMSALAMQRGLDWSNSLSNAQSMTSLNRNKPSNCKTWSPTYAGNADGTPLEILVALCNQCNSALYWCCPIVADSTYYTDIATVLRDSLNPWIPIYLEIGDEIWAGVGVSNSLTTSQANAYNASNPGVLTFDSDSTQTTLNARYTGVQCKTIYDIFNSVFGGNTRFKNVFAWQTGGSGLSVKDRVWRFMANQYGSVTPYIRAAALAPYMTRDNTLILSDSADHRNVNDTKANILTQIGLNALYSPFLAGAESAGCQAAWFGGIESMNYEGDWETGGETTSVVNLGAAIMDAGMTTVVQNNIKACFNAGIKWYPNTAFGVYNTSSVKDPQYQLATDYATFVSSGSPRYSALTSFSSGYPTPTRNVVSGSGSVIDWINYLDNNTGLNTTYQYLGGVSSFGIGAPAYGVGGLHGIHLNVTQAGTYSVTTSFTTTAPGSTPATGTTGVYLDGATLFTGLSITSGSVTFSLTLTAGDHWLVLGNKGGASQSSVFPKISTFN